MWFGLLTSSVIIYFLMGTLSLCSICFSNINIKFILACISHIFSVPSFGQFHNAKMTTSKDMDIYMAFHVYCQILSKRSLLPTLEPVPSI